MRAPAAAVKPRVAKVKSFPAPVGGWVANRNLALGPRSDQPQGAAILQNYFPTGRAAVLRRGSILNTTIGDGSGDVRSLFSYVAGNNKHLFAADDSGIFDITTPSYAEIPVLGTELGAALVTETGQMLGQYDPFANAVMLGLTSGRWSVVQFATAGGVYLRGVNGQDTPFVYDGDVFSTTPALTFPDGVEVSASDLINVWAYKNRLFFIQKESLDVWYLPVDQIGGELTKIPLGGVFGRGGSLVFGATWSLDSGAAGGLSEQCILMTTEGEVAVYQGDNPGDADSWSKVGVYRIGKPLGPKAFIRAGGDLLIATTIGAVPLSQAIRRDYAALSPAAVSYAIEDEWNEAVAQRSGEEWHCEIWPSGQMLVVALPTINEQPPVMYVANARTGAWAEYTGWDGTCLIEFNDRLFFGSVNGRVMEANVSGLDDGKPYTGTYVPLFEDLKTPASLKVTGLARAVFRSPSPLIDNVAVQTDYVINLPAMPDASPTLAGSQWDVGKWGESVWGQAGGIEIRQDWRSVSGMGYALAPSAQVTSGAIVPLDAELVRIDLTYWAADIVT